jgi:hypothetical protein
MPRFVGLREKMLIVVSPAIGSRITIRAAMPIVFFIGGGLRWNYPIFAGSFGKAN